MNVYSLLKKTHESQLWNQPALLYQTPNRLMLTLPSQYIYFTPTVTCSLTSLRSSRQLAMVVPLLCHLQTKEKSLVQLAAKYRIQKVQGLAKG